MKKICIAGSCQKAASILNRTERRGSPSAAGLSMAKVKAHKVKCQFCKASSIVLVNAEICPKCCQYGYLEWEEGTADQIFDIEESDVEIAAEETELRNVEE